MNIKKQRRKILEATGWTLALDFDKEGSAMFGMAYKERYDYGSPKWVQAPDPTKSLDDMHEAEMVVEEKRLYVDWLTSLMKPGEYTVMAPVEKRREAFLKALKLWEES